MIDFFHSMCMIYYHSGEARGVANDTNHRVSTKDMVEVKKSYLCLGGRSTLFPRSFCLSYIYRF